MVAFFVAGLAYRNHDKLGHDTGAAWVHSPIHWLLPVWLAPFALAVVIDALVSIPAAASWTWRHRPLRRASESVEDMRDHYRQ